jgi:hypothetical protein
MACLAQLPWPQMPPSHLCPKLCYLIAHYSQLLLRLSLGSVCQSVGGTEGGTPIDEHPLPLGPQVAYTICCHTPLCPILRGLPALWCCPTSGTPCSLHFFLGAPPLMPSVSVGVIPALPVLATHAARRVFSLAGGPQPNPTTTASTYSSVH